MARRAVLKLSFDAAEALRAVGTALQESGGTFVNLGTAASKAGVAAPVFASRLAECESAGLVEVVRSGAVEGPHDYGIRIWDVGQAAIEQLLAT